MEFCHIDRQVEVIEVTAKARGALGMNANHAIPRCHDLPWLSRDIREGDEPFQKPCFIGVAYPRGKEVSQVGDYSLGTPEVHRPSTASL